MKNSRENTSIKNSFLVAQFNYRFLLSKEGDFIENSGSIGYSAQRRPPIPR